jgi:branched-chain amino acid transport system substrate-binding protein
MWLGVLGGAVIASAALGMGDAAAPAKAADTIKLCIVESISGDFAIYGVPKLEGYKLAVKEINEAGGVLGKQIELIHYDGQSVIQRFQELGEKCILDDEAPFVMGGTTASEREALRAVAVKNKTLYWHNNMGEGGIADHYSFFSGSIPEQLYLPSMKYMFETFGKKVYGLFADYGYGQVSSIWFKAAAGLYGGEIVGLEYIPLGNSDFATTIANIQKAKPDWIAPIVVGGAQFNFYPQAQSAGLKLPMLTAVNVQLSYDHRRYPPPVMANAYVPFTFVEELKDTVPSAKSFVEKIREQNPSLEYVNEMARDAYVAVHLTAEAIERAGSTDTEEMISALQSGLSFDAPEGRVFLDPATHHLTMHMRIMRVNDKHELEPVADLGQLEPWWLRSIGVNLVKESPSTQFVPWDDPRFAKYKDE